MCVAIGWNKRVHLDAAEEWVANGDVAKWLLSVAVDLVSVAVHEIGKEYAGVGIGHEVKWDGEEKKKKTYSKSHVFRCTDTLSHLNVEITRCLKHHV